MSAPHENIEVRNLGPTTGIFFYQRNYVRHSNLPKQVTATRTHLSKHLGHLIRRRIKNRGGYLIT